MPEMVEACRRQDFTTILGLARKYTGASYNLISRCTGIAPTEISAIVNGRQQVEKFNRILAIANALAMPDSARVLLGLAPGSTPAAARLTGRRAVLHGAVVGTGAALTGGLLTALDGAQQALRRSLADEPLDRCDIERLEESADGLALFSPTAPPVEALTRMLLDFLEVQESLGNLWALTLWQSGLSVRLLSAVGHSRAWVTRWSTWRSMLRRAAAIWGGAWAVRTVAQRPWRARKSRSPHSVCPAGVAGWPRCGPLRRCRPCPCRLPPSEAAEQHLSGSRLPTSRLAALSDSSLQTASSDFVLRLASRARQSRYAAPPLGRSLIERRYSAASQLAV
jgi:hypothetical protein